MDLYCIIKLNILLLIHFAMSSLKIAKLEVPKICKCWQRDFRYNFLQYFALVKDICMYEFNYVFTKLNYFLLSYVYLSSYFNVTYKFISRGIRRSKKRTVEVLFLEEFLSRNFRRPTKFSFEFHVPNFSHHSRDCRHNLLSIWC